MLQQTQVAAVIPYYEAFLRRFPNLAALARARQSSVLAQWSGLGYYARARNLHAAAKIMHAQGIPVDFAAWQELPGVGRSTAAAVAVFAHGERCAILDGNVKRVLARTHLCAAPINAPAGEAALWELATALLPPKRVIRPYTQGLMDIGATLCKRQHPQCTACPLAARCLAHQQGKTADYPRKVARGKKPEKTAHFALVCCNNKVLLQRQPPRGIWGGLWSLPPVDGDWEQCFACGLEETKEIKFQHEFTHYRLHAKVTVYRADDAAAVTMPLRWHRNWQKTGMPAPIRKVVSLNGV